MPYFEALKLALSSILSHKLRSFLALLGVIFGVATVIIVVSLIEGFNAYVDEKIANIGTNAFSVRRFSIEDFSSVEALNAATLTVWAELSGSWSARVSPWRSKLSRLLIFRCGRP
jgi:ABC-type antimicrobial peptide transport system permease subunit